MSELCRSLPHSFLERAAGASTVAYLSTLTLDLCGRNNEPKRKKMNEEKKNQVGLLQVGQSIMLSGVSSNSHGVYSRRFITATW